MKFIISTFSPKIFSLIVSDFDLKWHRLNHDEFMAAIYDAYSCVGYEDVANILNVTHNKEPAKARIDDWLFLADMSNGVLEYWCIQICPSESPLVRAEEREFLEEEMI